MHYIYIIYNIYIYIYILYIYRLINPAKSEIGKVSKRIIEKINEEVKSLSNVNQWKNTKNVTAWFQDIENKKNCSFTQFDIEEFYPSISKDLLLNSIEYAKQFTSIKQSDIDIVMHARKSILFNDNDLWIKRHGDPNFDVTMGSFDGAELCELVGLYILHTLGETYGVKNLGLYRDDGLAYFRNLGGPACDRIRKDMISLFKDKFGLKITISTNLKVVNFLDVTLNLLTGLYQPFKKPNDTPVYINVNSNHPPNIIKTIPEIISKRISDISSNEDIFKQAAPYYNNALSNSGYKDKISYTKEQERNPKNRGRNIIWFNPPIQYQREN